MKVIKLNGNDLAEHLKELSNKGFAEVSRDICKKILKDDDVTYHELRFIIDTFDREFY